MKQKFLTSFLLFLSLTVCAQEEEVAAISGEACTCIEKIDASLERTERYEEVESCITSPIIAQQLRQSMLKITQQVKDTLGKGALPATDSLTLSSDVTIAIDSYKEYKKIQKYLLENCKALQGLMMNESKEEQHSASKDEEAIKYYNEGQEYYRQGKFEEAIKKYEKAVKQDDNFAFAWDMIGLSYRQLHQYKKAIEYYKKSLEVQPGGRVPLMNIPVAYRYLEEYEKAIAAYKKFIEVFPDDPEGHYGIGRACFMSGAYEKALENMCKAYILYEEQGSPYVRDAEQNIAMFYTELKKLGKLAIFEKVAAKYNLKMKEE